MEKSHRYYIALIIALLSVLIVSPFFENSPVSEQFFGATLVLSMIFSIVVISHSIALTFISSVAAVPLIGHLAITVVGASSIFDPLIVALSGTALIALVIVIMARDIFGSRRIDSTLIIGSICLYLLLGLLWGFAYFGIEQVYPESFSVTLGQLQGSDIMSDLIYFSLVTLTTLGYGDVAPLSSPARSMAAIQAVTGQLYLTILVARLVGLHLTQHNDNGE